LKRLLSQPLALIDLGTDKAACWIIQKKNNLQLLGSHHQKSQGVDVCGVTNLSLLEECIAETVAETEKKAGVKAPHALVIINHQHLQSHRARVRVEILGKTVIEEDLKRLFMQAHLEVDQKQSLVIHTLPITYALDGQRGIQSPLGMLGCELSCVFQMISIDRFLIQNFLFAFEKSHLQIVGFMSAPYASGLACLTENERQMGSVICDLGASHTGLAFFFNGQCILQEVLPMGGRQITQDLAYGLDTTVANAEKLKVLHGNCFADAHVEERVLSFSHAREHGARALSLNASYGRLADIIKPRTEEFFEHIKKFFKRHRALSMQQGRVILTGGASQLSGIQQVAEAILGQSVRLGRPQGIDSILEESPDFAALMGAAYYLLYHSYFGLSPLESSYAEHSPFWKKLSYWLRQKL
jgi:cell division protein FtsA